MALEIKWSVGRAWTLIKCWYLPVNKSPAVSLNNDEAMATRALALLIVVALTFAIRDGDITDLTRAGKISYTAYTIGLSSALALLYEFLSRGLKFIPKNSNIITFYGFLIVSMFVYLMYIQFGNESVYYQYIESLIGNITDSYYVVTPIILSLLSVWMLFLVKTLIFNRVQISFDIFISSLKQSILAAILTTIIVFLSNNLFDWVLSKLL